MHQLWYNGEKCSEFLYIQIFLNRFTQSNIFSEAHAQVGFFIFSNLPHRLDPTTLMGYNVIILIFLKSLGHFIIAR